MLINPCLPMPGVDHPQQLDQLESLFANPVACCRSFDMVADLVVELAAKGYAKSVLELAADCPDPVVLRPLTDGVRLHLGMVITSTGAARSLAIHIAETIRNGSGLLSGV